jgi:hypothetical protein
MAFPAGFIGNEYLSRRTIAKIQNLTNAISLHKSAFHICALSDFQGSGGRDMDEKKLRQRLGLTDDEAIPSMATPFDDGINETQASIDQENWQKLQVIFHGNEVPATPEEYERILLEVFGKKR